MSRFKVDEIDDPVAVEVVRRDMGVIQKPQHMQPCNCKDCHPTPAYLTAEYKTDELRDWAADTGVFSTFDPRLPGTVRRQAD